MIALRAWQKSLVLKRFLSASPNIKLIQQLKRETECTLTKAKQALQDSGFDYQKAVALIRADLLKKGQKPKNRLACEGLIGVYSNPLGTTCALVELNSETDFVSKSPTFIDLIKSITQSIGIYSPSSGHGISSVNVQEALSLKVLNFKEGMGESGTFTIGNAIDYSAGKIGEVLKLRNGYVCHADPYTVTAGYTHGSNLESGVGRIGCLIVLQSSQKLSPVSREQITKFSVKLAQHCVGMNPERISPVKGVDKESCLESQGFLFGGGTVAERLEALGLELGGLTLTVKEFKRIECGEGLEKPVNDFGQQVMDQILH